MKPALRFLLTLFTILYCTTISGASIQESQEGVVFEKACVLEGEIGFFDGFNAPKTLPTTGGVALGKDIGGSGVKALADQTGSSYWRNWARDGVTRRTVDRHFGRAFHQAVDRAPVVRFTLDGIDDVAGAVRAGKAGFNPRNFTNAELHYIATNPEILAKTIFYRGGQVVKSPF